MLYCSPFIKFTLYIRNLNDFPGDSITVNYRMSEDLKGGKDFQ